MNDYPISNGEPVEKQVPWSALHFERLVVAQVWNTDQIGTILDTVRGVKRQPLQRVDGGLL